MIDICIYCAIMLVSFWRILKQAIAVVSHLSLLRCFILLQKCTPTDSEFFTISKLTFSCTSISHSSSCGNNEWDLLHPVHSRRLVCTFVRYNSDTMPSITVSCCKTHRVCHPSSLFLHLFAVLYADHNSCMKCPPAHVFRIGSSATLKHRW